MKTKHDNGFPGRDAIVAFIRANPGKIGTREIAREFGLKNADRVELKRILRELADEGAIAKRGRKIDEPAALPPTVIAETRPGAMSAKSSIGVLARYASNGVSNGATFGVARLFTRKPTPKSVLPRLASRKSRSCRGSVSNVVQTISQSFEIGRAHV